jgi:hypothetical protein
VPATAAETVAEVVGRVARGGHAIHGFGTQAQWVVALRTTFAQSDVPELELEYLHGACLRAFQLPQAVTGLPPNTGVAEIASRALDFRARCIAALGARVAGDAGSVTEYAR